MTAEEAIEILSDVGDINRCCAEDAEALDMAIKALEHEAILDKIRAEIEEERKGYPPSADEYKTINKVLQIFDKYKAESEDKE